MTDRIPDLTETEADGTGAYEAHSLTWHHGHIPKRRLP